MRAWLCFLTVVGTIAFGGCRRRAAPPPASPAPEPPTAGPVTGLSTPTAATAPVPSLVAVDVALGHYVEKHGVFPPKLHDLVTSGLILQIPSPPPGKILKYDPQRRFVGFVDAAN